MTVAKKRGGRAKGYFPKVREARKVLTDNALELYELYKAIAKQAAAAEDFLTAEKVIWNLLSHMPEDEDTGTLLGTSIDKNREPDRVSSGPAIQIGLALGGMPSQAALPPASPLPKVIQVKPGPKVNDPDDN